MDENNFDQSIEDTLRETYAKISGETTEVESNSDELNDDEEAIHQKLENESHSEDDQSEESSNENNEPEETQKVNFKPPWKKTALGEYEKLSESVRAEIERRENDFHKGIEQYKSAAQVSQEWDKAVQPYLPTINSFGVTPQVAAAELFKTDHLLRNSAMPQKVGMLLKIANDYGVDLQTLANGIQSHAGEKVWEQQNPVDPRLADLQNQIGNLTNHINQTQQNQRNAENSAIEAEIAAFAADPNNEHFEILKHDMGVLLQNRMAKNLPDAYEMAMRQNPQTYQILLAQQQKEWDAQRKAKIEKAKKAGSNNVRPNGRASVPVAQPARSLEEELEATARSLGLLN